MLLSAGTAYTLRMTTAFSRAAVPVFLSAELERHAESTHRIALSAVMVRLRNWVSDPLRRCAASCGA
jgi:hypothetical protein